MAALDNTQMMIKDHHGTPRPKRLGIEGLGRNKVHLGHNGKTLKDMVCFSPYMACQRSQDAFYFRLFFKDILLDVIIEVNNGHRLNKERCPA
ncbi:unknown [Acidaminococcus intestini CAG:325]|nr:unknown [Acidaminococcus intestini CAG:325]